VTKDVCDVVPAYSRKRGAANRTIGPLAENRYYQSRRSLVVARFVLERIVGNWRLNRMAAEYEADSSEDAAPILEELFVDGIAIGGSYGHSEDGDDQFLPASYVKSFASAMPTPRPGGYDPAVDLPRETAALGTEDKVTAAMLQRSKANHVVAPSGESVASGGSGGSNGGGAAKKIKPRSKAGPRQRRDLERNLERFQVSMLQRGVVEYFHANPGLAIIVVIDAINDYIRACFIDNEFKPKIVPVAKGAGYAMELYGLSETRVRLLKKEPGFARSELTKYALSRDGERIAARDIAA